MQTRRGLLAGAAGTLAALSGCLGTEGGGASTASPTPERTPNGTPAETTASGPFGGHPAARGLDDQPVLGDLGAGSVVVAFEDPSCTLCRRFEQQTLPRIEEELVATGEGAFVYRVYPIIYPWGKPAVQALESTFARDADAFWALKDHYYGQQDAFTTENVLDRTETFLASETDLDAAAVVDDARNERHDDAVQADLAAGEAAGVGSQTPVFYLFSEGEFQTRISGPQDYSVFAAALGK
jgi:protein-disulfide isomerase